MIVLRLGQRRFFALLLLCFIGAPSCKAGSVLPFSGAGWLGGLKYYFGASAVWTFREVKVSHTMNVSYNAAYIYAANGIPTLQGPWGAVVAQVRNVYALPLTAQIPAAGNNAPSEDAGRSFVFSGAMPVRWYRGSNHGRAFGADPANTVAADVPLLTAALFAPGAHYNAPGALPNDRAWVPSRTYNVTSVADTTLDYSVWGVRAELGVGFSAFDIFSCGILLSYYVNFDQNNQKNKEDGVSFDVESINSAFMAADGITSVHANLVGPSFAHANGKMAAGCTVRSEVFETFGAMCFINIEVGGFGGSVRCGWRRYNVAMILEDGFLSYPGTVGMYDDSFTKGPEGCKLHLMQSGVVRQGQKTAWPLVWGGGISYRFFSLLSAHFCIDYVQFSVRFNMPKDSSESDTNVLSGSAEDLTYYALELQSPYASVPTAAQMRDGVGVHQMNASNVRNTLSAEASVRDIVCSLGLSLRL